MNLRKRPIPFARIAFALCAVLLLSIPPTRPAYAALALSIGNPGLDHFRSDEPAQETDSVCPNCLRTLRGAAPLDTSHAAGVRCARALDWKSRAGPFPI